MKAKRTVTLGGGIDTTTVFKVEVSDYIDKLVDQTSMKIFLMGRVEVRIIGKACFISSCTTRMDKTG